MSKTIILNWTKAHAGVDGNERADILAKIDLKNKITEFFYEEWKKDFQAYDGARMGKLFYEGPDANKAKYVLKLSRAHLGRFIRIIAGHNSLFYFRHQVDKEVNPQCRFCLEENETFDHLVNDCPRFINDRRDILKNELITNDHMWSVQTLLDFSMIQVSTGSVISEQSNSPS